MSSPIRCALVGCGTIAKVHLAVLDKLQNVSLVACADTNLARAEAAAAQYGCRAYASLEDMLDHEEIDALHICTPHALHTPMIENAVARGLAVLTEKPPVASRAQWEILKNLPDTTRVGVCFQNRYNPETRALKELVEGGKLGKVLGCRAFVTWKRDKAYYDAAPWRGLWREAGGGALANQAIHTLDLMVYLLGAPTSSRTHMANSHLRGVVEVEDTVESHLLFGDKVGLFYATTAYPADRPVLLEVLGENGTARMEDGCLDIMPRGGERQRVTFDRPEPLGKSYWGNGHFPYIEDFYARMAAGLPPAVGLREVAPTVELMLDMYEQNVGNDDLPGKH